MNYQPIFLSGPHGGGKTTLINKLKESNLFIENDFDIDFTIDFPSIASLSHFERSLVRIYHRFYLNNYAEKLVVQNPEKIVLTNRTVYDSESYINVYNSLGWITPHQFEKLNHVLQNFSIQPYAIVLNPPFETILQRLQSRRDQAIRTNRDKIFQNEDSDEFLLHLRDYFEKFKNNEQVLYLEDNSDAEIAKIINWVQTLRI